MMTVPRLVLFPACLLLAGTRKAQAPGAAACEAHVAAAMIGE
jgi:hypothetical protein